MSTCTWPVDYSHCSTCEPLVSSPASGLFEQMAVDYLNNWTKQKFGQCEVVVRPCLQDCTEGASTFWGSGPFPGRGSPWRPVIIDGKWFNLGCGVCGDACGCGHVEQIRLPGPIASVQQIRIDGAVLDPSKYRVDDVSLLVRLDGGIWPHCQDLTAAPSQPDTWEVTYTRGHAVPVGGQVAAGILACEFAKAACNDQSCQLPRRLQSLSRQGVTMSFMDPSEVAGSGYTGIWLVDSWVDSVTKAPQRTQVLSPDLMPKVRRTTWP